MVKNPTIRGKENENFISNIVQSIMVNNEVKKDDVGGSTTVGIKIDNNGADTPAQVPTEKKPLEEEALQFLGDRVITERKYDTPIQDDLALRVTDIVTLGLSDEEIKSLTDNYYPPENCKSIDPPKVNIEVLSKDSVGKERDKRIVKNQLKGSASLAASTKAMTIMLNQESIFESMLSKIDENHDLYGETMKLREDRRAMLKHFGNAYRLSADIQHEHSMVRRGLLLGNLNEYSDFIKEQIKTTTIDEFLFGSNLAEVIKAAKTNDNSKQRNHSRKNYNNYPKNFKGPLRGQYRNQSPQSGGRHTKGTPSTAKNEYHRTNRRNEGKRQSTYNKYNKNNKRSRRS